MPKILIVDDEWLTRLEIEEMLTDLGYDVAGQAETGAEAVAMARELNPDLILMDVKMPGEMNGIDAAREIKAELGTPIVFVSGYGDPEYIEAAKEIAPFGYVMKPFDEREIHAFVEIALSRRKLELKLEEAYDELEQRVEIRTAELAEANKQLKRENEAHKRTVEELRESEKKLNAILDATTETIVLIGKKGIVRVANKTVCDRLTTTKEEIIGKKLYDFFSPQVAEGRRKKWNRVFETGKPVSFEDSRAGMIFEQVAYPILGGGDQVEMVAVFANDITDRVQAEQALRESERHRKSLMESASNFAVYRLISDGDNPNLLKVVLVSPSITDIMGVSEPMSFETWFKHLHPDDVERIVSANIEAFKTLRFNETMRIYHPQEQKWVWIHAISTGFEDHERQCKYVNGILIDITREKEAEKALGESEEKYRTLVEESFDGIFIQRGQNIIFANKRLNEMLGYGEGELIGQDHWAVYHPEFQALTRERALARMGGAKVTPRYEVKLQRKDGSWFFGEINARSITFPSDEMNGIQVWVKDIHERKQAEEALHKSEERYRSLVENQTELVSRFTPEGTFAFVNDAYCHFFEKGKDELVGKKWHPLPVDEDLTLIQEKLQTLSPSNPSVLIENRIFSGKGDIHWMQFVNSGLFDLDGNLMEIQSVGRDITEHKQTEKALQESGEKYRGLFDESIAAVYLFDNKKNFLDSNQAGLDLLGYPREELLSMSIPDVDANPMVVQPAHEQLLSGDKIINYEHELRRKDGKDITVLNNSRPLTNDDGQVVGMQSTLIDITEQKRSDRALRESEEKFKHLVKNSNDVFVIIDENAKEIFVSDSVEVITGFTPAEVMGHSGFEFLHPDDLDHISKTLSKLLETPGGTIREEYRHRRKDGGWVYLEAIGTNYLHEPSVKGVVLNIRDITEHRQTEKRLLESEERFRSLVEASPQLVFLGQNGKFIYGNPAGTRLLGYGDPSEIVGTQALMNIAPEFRDRVRKRMEKNESNMENVPEEIKMLKLNGDPIWVLSSSVSVKLNGKTTAIIVGQDITEKKKMENELLQSQKMEAIGTLAGGVAHDLNNILGGLVSYPELLLLQLPEESPLRKSILTIQKSGEKAAAVVQDLLTLARRGVVVTEVVELNAVIAEYLKSPEHEKLQSYHPGVHLETHLEKDALNILGSSTHLSKTVMNLISNAAEAMPEGGKLTISTENRHVDTPIKGYDAVKEGDFVVLTISDTGTGIPPDDIEKIFEPFYTKKKMGRSGTGLGMAVVWGTVKDHNGYIHVQSTEGRGTTFTLYFPVTRKKFPEDESSLSVEAYSGNGESVLVVDDVEEQRQIASGMLEELGYSVVSVSSGEEAVKYLKTNKADVLLLDMIMDPGMDGLDTYKQILELHPGQKAIITSGFSETDRAKELQSLGAGAYIRKPFLMAKVGLAVKEELEK